MSKKSCLLTALLLLAAGAAHAATPSQATLSDSSGVVTWTGNPLPPTASNVCGGPNSAACDNFALSIVPPSYSFKVNIAVASGPSDDYDLEVYDPAGNLIASSGEAPGVTETATLINPAAGTYTVSVANYAALLAYSGSAEMASHPPSPPLGNEAPTFAIYTAPDGMGTNSGEPSVGVNWNTDRIMYIAGLETLQIELDDCSSPAVTQWTDVTFPLTGIVTLDPILFTDPITGRTFASQLSAKCSSMAFTDDDGANWTPSQGCGINAGVDHQSVGGGPFADPLTRDPDGLLYPHAVYYCSQDVAIAQCARSDTGGLTFNEAVPIYDITECGGLHGHVKVAPDDGTVYVPNKGCNGEQAVAVSEQNGLLGTWQVRRVPGTSSGEWDPSVGIGAEGTLYIGMTNGGRPMVAVSNDKGQTWSTPIDVGLNVGPTGSDILNTAFPVVIAGDDDRAAFGFLGAEQGGDGGGTDPNSPHVWYPYVSVTYDGGQTWSTTNLTPGDPVQRGHVCSSGTTCGASRNLLDFNDIQVDREGRIVFAYADGCLDTCKKSLPNSGAELATLARQKGGKRLFAAYDTPDVPAAPKASATYADDDPTRPLISWEVPDDHGSPIVEYRIYRRFQGGNSASQIATVNAGTLSYEDLVSASDPLPFYRVTAVTAFGEGPSCMWVSPTLAPPPPSPCVEPGPEVLSDGEGDALTTLPAHDVLSLSISQPFDLGGDVFVFTLKMASLESPTPDTTWPVIFNSADGNDYFVRMATDLLGNVSFESGVGNDVTAAGVPAHPASGFSADGTIRIAVDASAIGSPTSGGQLSQFLTRIRIEGVLVSPTPDNMPDSLGRIGSYDVADCSPVVRCASAAISDQHHSGNSDHAMWLPGIGTDFVFESGATFVEFPDGTARLTGTAVDSSDSQKRFDVDVAFFDRTETAPPGSPKKELKSSAYVENGGPVDTSTWIYYESMLGSLSGEGSYDGASVRLYRRGASFQEGVGASGKNALFGGSGWLTYGVEQQPSGGGFSYSGKGDFNLTLECP